MLESLSDFIQREAGPDQSSQLALIRHLAPFVFVAGGYDFNELRELENADLGSEYVSSSWPDVPVVNPLPCITIRPFNPHGYTTPPYELVSALSGHLRDLLVGAQSAPDFEGILRFGYIKPDSVCLWNQAASSWRTNQVGAAPAALLSRGGGSDELPETPERRQARRYQMCIDAGLEMPADDYKHMPRGIGRVAKDEGVSRQAFVEDVKHHINRLNRR